MAALLAQQARAKQYGTRRAGQHPPQEVLSWREPQKQINYYPTVRIDYQVRNNLSS